MNRAQRMQNRDNAQALGMFIEEIMDAQAAQAELGAIADQLIDKFSSSNALYDKLDAIADQLIDNAVLTITPPIL